MLDLFDFKSPPCDKISPPAPVAQWTECRPPEPKSAVRVRAGALSPPRGGFCFHRLESIRDFKNQIDLCACDFDLWRGLRIESDRAARADDSPRHRHASCDFDSVSVRDAASAPTDLDSNAHRRDDHHTSQRAR